MSRRTTLPGFLRDSIQPAQLGPKLFDGQREHPNSLVELVPDFRANRLEHFFLASQLPFEKFLAALDLPGENAGTGLPGKRHPREKWRTFAGSYPIAAFQSIRERRNSALRGLKNTPLRTFGGIGASAWANESRTRELLDGIVDLWPRDARPVANLAPFQFGIGLIAVHRRLG